jgi:hypothetical protein
MSLLVFKSQKCKPLDKAVLPLQASFGSLDACALKSGATARCLARDTHADSNRPQQFAPVAQQQSNHTDRRTAHHDTTVLHRTHTHVGIFANRIGESSALLCLNTAFDWQMRLFQKTQRFVTNSMAVTTLLGQNPSTPSSTTLIFLLNSDY